MHRCVALDVAYRDVGPADGDPADGDPADGDPATGDPATGDPHVSRGVASAVVFDGWGASRALSEHVAQIDALAPYVPGRFYERELPCLLAVLAKLSAPCDVVIVDGYVTLDQGRPGLGAVLYDALGSSALAVGTPVVGVAKAPFVRDGNPAVAIEVRRGTSRRPLFVTAAGMDPAVAADCVRAMHGAHRIPTMLKRTDALGREVLAQSSTTQLRPNSLAR